MYFWNYHWVLQIFYALIIEEHLSLQYIKIFYIEAIVNTLIYTNIFLFMISNFHCPWISQGKMLVWNILFSRIEQFYFQEESTQANSKGEVKNYPLNLAHVLWKAAYISQPQILISSAGITSMFSHIECFNPICHVVSLCFQISDLNWPTESLVNWSLAKGNESLSPGC